MRWLLTLLCIVWLGIAAGCGRGYEGRKAPRAGAGDPSAIVNELRATQSGAAADTQPAAAEESEEAAEKKPAEKAKSK